jgi:type III restriction enzyme
MLSSRPPFGVPKVLPSAPRSRAARHSKWEQSAAYHLDSHPHVVAFVKNQGLGFAIPYLHEGGLHNYVPDFMVRLDNGIHLVLETKGHDELGEVKRQAAERWVRAVNAEGSFGEWRYEMSHEMNAIPQLLDAVAASSLPLGVAG